MTKEDRDAHIDARLTLLLIDRAESGNPRPMDRGAIAKETGMTKREVYLTEMSALYKLRNHPKAWEAVTAAFRQ